MSMIPNLPLAAGVWHDFYAVTGFAPGEEVIGCNGGSARICLYQGDKPDASVAMQGWDIPAGGGFSVKADSVWVRGNGSVVLCGLQDEQAITPMAWHGLGSSDGGSGSFDGAVTVADGANAALGSTADFPSEGPGEIATLISDIRGFWADVRNARGRSTNGALLPSDFEFLARSMTYDSQGRIQTETRTNGPMSWVKTYAYDGDNLGSMSAWVQS